MVFGAGRGRGTEHTKAGGDDGVGAEQVAGARDGYAEGGRGGARRRRGSGEPAAASTPDTAVGGGGRR